MKKRLRKKIAKRRIQRSKHSFVVTAGCVIFYRSSEFDLSSAPTSMPSPDMTGFSIVNL